MTTNTHPSRKGEKLRLWVAVLFVLLSGVLYALGMGNAHAATAAGTVIGNQATATYNDAGGTGRSATSNLVTTTVSQVKAFALTLDGARTAAPGQTVFYPHTITNNGNGTDAYTLNTPIATGGGFTHTGVAYYIDANGDGVPDNNTPITTSGPIVAGGTFKFVVAGTVPAGAALGATGTITPSVSDTSGGAAQTNTDTTTVASSVISVTKSLSVATGPSPSAAAITVTLSYTNSGNSGASAVQLTDALPAGMTYVAGSGRWSVSGAAALTDAVDGVEQGGINYSLTGTTITAIVSSVPAGVSGTVTFQVNIAAGLAPQIISNTAQYQTATQTSSNTNAATYTVVQTASVVANGANNNSNNNVSEPLSQGPAGAGTTVLYSDYIWNRGNATDTFDITVTANTFPVGSSVTLLQQDGASTLLNSSGSPAPDTGPVPGKGATCTAPFVTDGTYCGYKVVVRVTLPANAAAGGPYSVTLTATSVFDTSQTDTVIDTLTAITANTVDITNNAPLPTTAANGAGPGPVAVTPITILSQNPSSAGSTTWTFQVYVNNTGFVNDSFDLSSVLKASSNGAVVPPALPAGWTVQFLADGGGGACATVGGSLTNTGTINAGANRLICARVTVPSTTTGTAFAGNFDFRFTATSATTGATDWKDDRVTVGTVHSIIITPSNVQQTFPGGSVTYTHTISNSGNAADTATFAAGCLVDSRSGAGYTSTAYIDSNGNGTLEIGTDTLINCGSTTLPLAINQSVTILVRVFAPGSATGADPADVATLTATYNVNVTTSATDTTSVTDGLVLLKEQAPVNCAAVGPHAGYVTAAIPAGANTAPGQCIAYRITGTNTTAGTITSVVISDIVPANTKMKFACSGNGVANPTVSVGSMAAGSAADNAVGTVIANVGTLTSTQAAVLYFCVQIQ